MTRIIYSGVLYGLWLLFFLVSPGLAQEKKPQAAEQPPIPILNKKQAEKLPKESTQSDDIPLLDEDYERTLDELQKKGSALVTSAARWIDSFFDDPRYISEENRTRAKLKLNFGYSKFDDFEFSPGIDLRLNLPVLENRVNVFIQANDDDDFDTDSNPIADSDKNKDSDLTAGVKYFLAMGERYNVSSEVGVSSSYVYGGLRYRHLHPFFSDDWEGRLTNRLRYYTDDGWENKTSYDIESHLGERFFIRNTFTGVLSEKDDGFPFSAVLRLYQIFSIERALLYDAGLYMGTEPEFEVTDVQFKLRYRQRFYRDWLVLEVAPQITFPNDHDHEMNPGLVVKFEADFGYLKDYQAYQSIFKF